MVSKLPCINKQQQQRDVDERLEVSNMRQAVTHAIREATTAERVQEMRRRHEGWRQKVQRNRFENAADSRLCLRKLVERLHLSGAAAPRKDEEGDCAVPPSSLGHSHHSTRQPLPPSLPPKRPHFLPERVFVAKPLLPHYSRPLLPCVYKPAATGYSVPAADPSANREQKVG